MPNEPDDFVKIDEETLREDGFIPSGVKKYTDAVTDYARELRSKTILFADATKANNMPREATHEHVKAAGIALAGYSGEKDRTKLSIAGQISEYLGTAIAGAGVGHLDSAYGIIAFGIGTAASVILLTVRLSARRRS